VTKKKGVFFKSLKFRSFKNSDKSPLLMLLGPFFFLGDKMEIILDTIKKTLLLLADIHFMAWETQTKRTLVFGF
jgi:hypothetical protein